MSPVYLVKDFSQEQWLPKDEAIAMAEEGRLYAIVVHAKRGPYLRPKHGSKPFKDLLCLYSFPIQDLEEIELLLT